MTAAAVVAKEQKQHISPSGTDDNGDDGYVRLHVTPLDAELLGVVLPQSVLPRARNVSYHALATFPERRYGFVELPRQDADRLRAKLHGATLRGHKMRVEKARPEARAVRPGNDGEEEDNTVRAEKRKKEKKEKKEKKKSRKNKDDDESDRDGEELGVDADLGGTSRKRKRDHNVVDGVALTDRKVKRGWSEAADAAAAAPKKQRRDKKSDPKDKDKEARKKDRQEKKRIRSKYTEGEECLLKMKVPPGSAAAARDLLPEEDVVSKKKRKSKGKDREVTIHEFERTSKFPSFLKNAAGPADGAKGAAAEFVEGKGWVDDEGNVVEAVSLNKPPPRPAKKPKKRAPTPEPVVEEEDDDETSSSGTSSSGESDDEDEEIPVPIPAPAPEKKKKQQPEPQQPVADDSSDTSSSDSSDTSSSEDEEEEQQQEETRSPTAKAPHKAPEAARPVSSSSSRSLTIKIPPATPSGKAVHPLEALYKRDKNADGTQAAPEPFSFFGGDGDVDEDDDVDEDEQQGDEGPPTRLRTPMPMTPFTKQEFERRIVRSAAPTPDTAHPSRMANFWPAYEPGADGEADDDDADADMADDDDGQDADAPADKSASDFQSWFWENRRDLNRSWMSRRKSAAKEKRHRENKARASRAV